MNVLDQIKRNLRDGSLAHAYILEIEQGSYRMEMLHQIAKTILCEATDIDCRPCGECDSCKNIGDISDSDSYGAHRDLLYMSKTQGKGTTKKISYKAEEDVLPFLQRISLIPYGKYRVGIIDAGEILTEVAQNKILKTLEEPVDGAVIIIATATRENLLPTVRSRCVLLRDSGDRAATEDDVWMEIWNQKYFFQYRNMVQERIGVSKDTALRFLDALERSAAKERRIEAVLRIEEARRDLSSDMGIKQVLKRLFLQLRK